MIEKDKLKSLSPGAVSLGGIVGDRMDRCIANRVAKQEIVPLVERFLARSDGPDGFRGEFWGKWFTSLVLAWSYTPTAELEAKMREGVAAMLEAQSDDGCISTYLPEEQHGMWDMWSRKYVLLGLLDFHQATGDAAALQAAARMADHFASQLGEGKVHLADTGHWAWEGLPPSSVLEPVAVLYRLTGEHRFLELAKYILAGWESPSKYKPQGLQLIASALAGLPAKNVGNPKAYEQMSCFEGLCELYVATSERRYLDAAVALAMSIRETELTILGSGSNHEMWCGTRRLQTEILEQPLETCATATWMKLCFKLLRLTGQPLWADELEKTLYNALPAAMTPDGAWWSYYSPLLGERVASHYQYEDIGLSCCVASGPRAMLLTHRWAVMRDASGPVVNLYAPLEATMSWPGGNSITLKQETDYPVDGQVKIAVTPSEELTFTLQLRIPEWSHVTEIRVGGEEYFAEPGSYCAITRSWRAGDVVSLRLDMRTRAVPAPSGAPQWAMVRGPLVLALDNRLNEPSRESVRLNVTKNGHVETTLLDEDDDRFTLICEAPMTYHKVHIVSEPRTLRFCDYASAGNAWSGENLFRVWLPEPMFMEQAFIPDTWKLMYPDSQTRPDIPTARNDFE